MSEDLTGLSLSQLQERTQAVEAELRRRADQNLAQQAEAFAAELNQVRRGERRMDSEHVAHLTPREVQDALNRGQGQHMGIAPDRRAARR